MMLDKTLRPDSTSPDKMDVELRTLLGFAEMSSDWFWEQDAQFRFTRFFGHATDKLKQTVFLGKRRWEMPIDGVSQEQLAEHLALHESHLAFRNFEYQIANENGEQQFFSVSGTPIFGEDGHFTGYHGVGRNITELRLAQLKLEQIVVERTRELTQQLHFMQQLIEAIPGPVYYKDAESRYLGCNRAYQQFTGRTLQEMVGKTPHDISPKELADRYVEADHELLNNPGQQVYESQVRFASGDLRDVMFHKATFTNSDGNVGGMVGFMLDITERKRMEEKLRYAATVFANSTEGVTISTPDGTIIAVNRAFTEITGYSESEAVGSNPRMLQSGRHDKAFYQRLWGRIALEGRWEGEIWNRRKSGELFPEWITIAAVHDEHGALTNYIATFADITQHKKNEEKIQILAFTDPLTDLPNRRLLLDRLQRALASASRSKRFGALLFIGMDDFKGLNDTRGHEAGDLLLQMVAHRVVECVRPGDTVARLGSDEFVVMLEDLGEDEAAATRITESIGAKLLDTLKQPYDLAAYLHHCTASVGVTLFVEQHSEMGDLLKQADLALSRAKGSGRNTLRFFDPEMQAKALARVALETDLRQGLLDDQLVLYYQPQTNHLRGVTGAEALVRWDHPVRGMVAPGLFIPLAEETNLILPIGQWVLETACRQLRVWSDSQETAHLTMAVNVSARQFRQPSFVAEVQAALRDHGVDPHKLKLELTESLLLEDVEEIIAKMGTLKSIGVGFSLDDFGTGYSSLAYLKRLPLDQLKIDQSFVRDILNDANDAAIARAIVSLAHSLGLAVIAEGVETEDQRNFLAANKCHAYQGYLFSRPLPAADFARFVRVA